MPETPAAKPKVLIAGGEQVIADTMALILNHSGSDTLAMILSMWGGYQSSVAYDGWAGLRKAREMKPDQGGVQYGYIGFGSESDSSAYTAAL